MPNKAQDKYLHKQETPPQVKNAALEKEQSIRNEPKSSTSSLNGTPAGGLHPNSPPAPTVLSNTGNLDHLNGQLIQQSKHIEALEVVAGRLEQLVMAKQGTQTSLANNAQVQPFDESATLAGRMEWVNSRLHSVQDRMTQGLGQLQSLIA